MIDAVFKHFADNPPQMDNLWEFYLEDWNTDASHITKFNVTGSSIPFKQFETKNRKLGQSYYTGVTYPSQITVTLMEDVNFSVMNYFNTWEDQFYDNVTNVFKAVSKSTDKTGFLVFNTYKNGSGQQKLEILEKEVSGLFSKIIGGAPSTSVVIALEKEIDVGLIQAGYIEQVAKSLAIRAKLTALAQLKNVAQNALISTASSLGPVTPLLKEAAGFGISKATEKMGFTIPVRDRTTLRKQSVIVNANKSNTISTSATMLSADMVNPEGDSTMVIKLEGLKFIGLSGLSLDYTGSSPLSYTVTMDVERVLPDFKVKS